MVLLTSENKEHVVFSFYLPINHLQPVEDPHWTTNYTCVCILPLRTQKKPIYFQASAHESSLGGSSRPTSLRWSWRLSPNLSTPHRCYCYWLTVMNCKCLFNLSAPKSWRPFIHSTCALQTAPGAQYEYCFSVWRKKMSKLMHAVNQYFKGAIAFSVEADSSRCLTGNNPHRKMQCKKP